MNGIETGKNEISIIMPLFNAERFLPETLESIQKQTFKNFELICIDDCSTDMTYEILLDFQKRDNRIVIMSNEKRLRAGRTRNVGIEAAKGKYIIFLDGDDVFDEDMLELAYRAMQLYDTDFVFFNYRHFASDMVYETAYVEMKPEYIEKYCVRPFSILDYPPEEFIQWQSGPCNKLFKREFITSNDLRFQDLPACNDGYFVFMALFLAKSIIVLNEGRVLLHARDHYEPSRTTLQYDPKYTYLALEKLQDELIKRNMFKTCCQYFYHCFFINMYWQMVADGIEEEKKESLYRFLCEEGITKITSEEGWEYKNIDSKSRGIMKCFMELPFQSRWFEKTYLYSSLYLKKEEIIRLFNEEWRDKRIAIWGAGRRGKTLIDFLDENKICFKEVVDINPDVRKQKINGHVINDPKGICDRTDIIIVSTEKAYESVKEIIKTEKVEMFDIEFVLGNCV